MKIKNHIFLAVIMVSIGLVITNTTSSVNISSKTFDNEEVVVYFPSIVPDKF